MHREVLVEGGCWYRSELIQLWKGCLERDLQFIGCAKRHLGLRTEEKAPFQNLCQPSTSEKFSAESGTNP